MEQAAAHRRHTVAAGGVRGDKAYGSRANRAYLHGRRIACTILETADQIRSRKTSAPAEEDHPSSTGKSTHNATRSGAASTASHRAVATSTTNSPSATKPPCWSRPSTNSLTSTFATDQSASINGGGVSALPVLLGEFRPAGSRHDSRKPAACAGYSACRSGSCCSVQTYLPEVS